MPQGFSYRQVSDLYRTLKDAGVVSQDLPSWSSEMNRLSQSDLYSQGLNDNFIKQASTGLDRFIDWTGLPKVTGAVGEAAGGLVGRPELGRSIGEGTPRMLANMAPLAAATLAAPPSAGYTIPTALGLLGLGGMAGAETYTQTGSPAAGIVSGAVNAAMPYGMGLAERAAFRGVGGKILEGPIANRAGDVLRQQKPVFAGAPWQKAAGFAGGQVGAAALMEGGALAQTAVDPNAQYQFDPVAIGLNLGLGLLPFTALHLAGKVVGKTQETMPPSAVQFMLEQSKKWIAEKQVSEDAKTKTESGSLGPSAKPQEPNLTLLADTSARLARIRGEIETIAANGKPEDADRLDQLKGEELEAWVESMRAGGQGVVGEMPVEDSQQFSIVGKVRRTNKVGTWQAVEVVDTPENLAAGFTPGQIIGGPIPRGSTPVLDPTTGLTKYSFLTRFHDPTVVDKFPEIEAATKAELQSKQPNLPVNPRWVQAVADEREFAHDFFAVKAQMDAVPLGDVASYRQALENYKGVLLKHNRGTVNDAIVKAWQKEHVPEGTELDAAKGMVNNEVSRAALRETQKLAKLQEELDIFNKIREPQIRKQAGEVVDEQKLKESTDLENIYHRIAGTGRIDRFANAFHQWEETGRAGGVPRLQKLMEETIRQGGIKIKSKLVEDSALAAKMGTATTRPIRDIREAIAESLVTEMDPLDANKFVLAFAENTMDLPENRGFFQDSEMAAKLDAANVLLAKQGGHLPEASPSTPKIPAGGGFVWDMVPYDEGTNKLGKHPLPKTGILRESQFKNMAGEPILSDVVLRLGKEFVPEAFKEGDVNVPTLMKGLKEKGPVVEVKMLGGNANDPRRQRLGEVQHALDTLPGQGRIDGQDTPEYTALMNERDELRQQLGEEQDSAAQYTFVGPKSEQNMPGYVEGLVRVPLGKEKYNGILGERTKLPLYSGPHFGDPAQGGEDFNVLAFFRGYEETLPNGRKVFHVIEVQSDWGQERAKQDKHKAAGFRPDSRAFVQTHPLLSIYETLALKAAIDHARSVGADWIMLSDAETAMMTEGHDKVARVNEWTVTEPGRNSFMTFPTEGEAKTYAESVKGEVHPPRQISQEKGMRLHYDITLPSVLAKLTGEKGERIESVGIHKQAQSQAPDVAQDFGESPTPGSPVFTETDPVTGQQVPKKNISGLIFPLEKAFAKIDEQGGMTLTRPSSTPSTTIKPIGENGGYFHGTNAAGLAAMQEIGFTPRGQEGVENLTQSFNSAKSYALAKKLGTAHTFVIETNAKGERPVVHELDEFGDVVKSFPLQQDTSSLMPEGNIERIEAKPFIPQTDADKAKVALLAFDDKGPALVRFAKSISQGTTTFDMLSDLEKAMPQTLQRILPLLMEQSHEGLAGEVGNREIAIRLSAALMMGNDTARQLEVVVHELLHGLTIAELDNPTNSVWRNAFEAQRQRLIKRLSPEAQAHLKYLIDSNWISKFAKGDVEFKSMWRPEDNEGPINKFKSISDILYALQNVKEHVSQGFSSNQYKDFMQKTALPVGQPEGNLFQRLVQRLLRVDPKKITDNEFSAFLKISSNILKQGEWISDVSNFTDQYFAAKGLLSDAVQQQSRRALQLIQSQELRPDKMEMLKSLGLTESYAMLPFKTDLQKMQGENGEAWQSTKSILDELGATWEQKDNLLRAHMKEPMWQFERAMDMFPPEMTAYYFAKAADMREVLDGVRAAVATPNEGLLNIAEPRVLRKPVADLISNLDWFLQLQTEHEQQRVALARFIAVPDAFFDRIQAESSGAPKTTVTQGKAGTTTTTTDENAFMTAIGDAIGEHGGNALWKWAAPMAQLARTNKQLGEYFVKLILTAGKIRQMAGASMRVFSMDIDAQGNLGTEPSSKVLEELYKTIKGGVVGKAVDKLWGLQNIRGEKAVRALPYDDPEVKAILDKLSPEQRKQVIDIDNKGMLGKTDMDKQILDGKKQRNSLRASILVMNRDGIRLTLALNAAGQLHDALLTDFKDPTKAAIANQQIQQIAGTMSQEAFNDLVKFMELAVEDYKSMETHMEANPNWVSAKRGGKFLFEYFKNGEMKRGSADNAADAAFIAEGKQNVKNWKPNERSDDFFDFGVMTTEVLARARELEDRQIENLQNAGVSPEYIERMKRDSPIAQMEREANVAGRVKNVGPRTLSRGADELPWLENHIDWFTRAATFWQRGIMQDMAEALANEPGTKGTEVADQIRQHMTQFMTRDPEAGRQIQKVASAWALPFNFAGIISNGTQTFMRGVGELISLGHGPVDAFSEMLRSWKAVGEHHTENKSFGSPSLDKFMRDAKADHMFDPTMRDEELSATELSTVRLKQALNKEKPMTTGKYAATGAAAYTNAGMMLWKSTDYANNMAQLLASFSALEKLHPEMSYEETKKQAYLVNASVNDVGGRANRPIGPFSSKSPVMQTIAMTMMSLKSYSLGSTTQLIRHLKAGFFRPEGLTPSEIASARKAAIYQLGVQFAAAGAMGMPFAAASAALLNQAFPELEVNKKIRESVAALFGSDSQNGHILSDIALSGIPSMFGWDFQSRLNAGNVLPGFSEYNGFQPEQLLGVPASIVSNFVKGNQKIFSGDVGAGIRQAFVPPAFKKITELVAEGSPKDYRGRPVLPDVTPSERIGLGLGFQPKRLVDYNIADRLSQQSEHLSVIRRGQQNQALAEQALKGQFGSVRAVMQQQMQTDKEYNPANAVRAVARAAEEMTFPKDLRREGSRRDMDSRKQLLASFSLDPSAISEVARFQFRRQIEQRLGLMTQDSNELVKAQLMDQLRAADPQATRSSLDAAATQALRKSQTHQLLPVEP